MKTFMIGDKLTNYLAVHHTKNKGDLGVAKAYCDLVEKGFNRFVSGNRTRAV